MKLYIAYGSNLHKQQMEKRCPDAVPHAVVTLNGWELVYRGVNPNRIYATLQQKEGASTPVVLWEITPKDETNLDEYEDYPTLYYKQDIPVTLTDGTTILAMVYLMTDQATPGRPSDTYIQTIREGYEDFDLDLSVFEASLKHGCC